MRFEFFPSSYLDVFLFLFLCRPLDGASATRFSLAGREARLCGRCMAAVSGCIWLGLSASSCPSLRRPHVGGRLLPELVPRVVPHRRRRLEAGPSVLVLGTHGAAKEKRTSNHPSFFLFFSSLMNNNVVLWDPQVRYYFAAFPHYSFAAQMRLWIHPPTIVRPKENLPSGSAHHGEFPP